MCKKCKAITGIFNKKTGLLIHVGFMYVHSLEAFNREGSIIDTLKPILTNLQNGTHMVAFVKDEKRDFALATLHQAYITFLANVHQPIFSFRETLKLTEGK